MEKGYVKLWRAIEDNELLANDNTACFVFMRLLLMVDRHTGSITTGRNKLSARLNMKGTTLYAALNRLSAMTMLRQVSDNKKTTIYICNWHKYQQTDDKPMTAQRQRDDTIQEVEREYIDTNVSMANKSPKMEIDKIFDYWEEVVGYQITSQVQKNRWACSNLIKKLKPEGLRRTIDGVAKASQDPYGPRIADFVELQSNLNKLLAWGQKSAPSQSTASPLDRYKSPDELGLPSLGN